MYGVIGISTVIMENRTERLCNMKWKLRLLSGEKPGYSLQAVNIHIILPLKFRVFSCT